LFEIENHHIYDQVSFLVTPEQAEAIAHALLDAAEESRNTP